MLKHYIEGEQYIITDLDTNNIVFSVTLANDFPNNQIILNVNGEVYAGPIEFIHLKEE